jgi:hypothetical protein
MFKDYREQLADERLETERTFLLTVLARKARKSSFIRRKNVSQVDQVTMVDADSNLQELERMVGVVRGRLAQIIGKDADPAAIEVATDVCVETIAAVRSYLAQRK